MVDNPEKEKQYEVRGPVHCYEFIFRNGPETWERRETYTHSILVGAQGPGLAIAQARSALSCAGVNTLYPHAHPERWTLVSMTDKGKLHLAQPFMSDLPNVICRLKSGIEDALEIA